jgi:hypothetical protein
LFNHFCLFWNCSGLQRVCESGCVSDTYYWVVSSPPATACTLTLCAFIWLSELKLFPHISHLKVSLSVSDIILDKIKNVLVYLRLSFSLTSLLYKLSVLLLRSASLLTFKYYWYIPIFRFLKHLLS